MPATPDGRQPSRNFRASNELWDRASAAVRKDGTTISAVLVDALTSYCDAHDARHALDRIAELEARLHKLENPPRARRAPAPRTPKD